MIYKQQSAFPFIKQFKEKFAVTEKTIFVYREQADYPLVYFDDVIYCDFPLSSDLLAHEVEHLRRMKKIGAYDWIQAYLTDKEFRIKEEILAYKHQLSVILNREERNAKRLECARNLSSNLYGNIISFEEANRELMAKIK